MGIVQQKYRKEFLEFTKIINSKKAAKKIKKNSKKKTNIDLIPVLNLKEKQNYKLFLKSKYWQYVRNLVLIRDKKMCVYCDKKTRLEVHHKTYKNHLKEHLHLKDLITLCRSCHELEHSVIG